MFIISRYSYTYLELIYLEAVVLIEVREATHHLTQEQLAAGCLRLRTTKLVSKQTIQYGGQPQTATTTME